MALMYAGIDEAGYGPMLGPLCVAQSILSIAEWIPGDKAPDLWATLHDAVGKTKRDAKRLIPVGDSKNLKLANSSKTLHPLVHLERAVLAFLGARDGSFPTTDIQLFERLGAKLEDYPWYIGEPIKLPLGIGDDLLAIDASHLRSVMHRRGVELVDLRVRVIDVGEFNETYQHKHSKAAATELGLLEHLRSVADQRDAFEHTRIVCDRQGGRTRYHAMLSRVFDDLETHEESPRASRYGTGDGLGILLTPQADDAYFPVALASMAAKLVRELAMMRFNRYWATRKTELKPTAGYVQDARRWLVDMQGVITKEERQAMVRLA
jgi:ribonuclease HII